MPAFDAALAVPRRGPGGEPGAGAGAGAVGAGAGAGAGADDGEAGPAARAAGGSGTPVHLRFHLQPLQGPSVCGHLRLGGLPPPLPLPWLALLPRPLIATRAAEMPALRRLVSQRVQRGGVRVPGAMASPWHPAFCGKGLTRCAHRGGTAAKVADSNPLSQVWRLVIWGVQAHRMRPLFILELRRGPSHTPNPHTSQPQHPDPRFGPLYGCAKLHFTDLAQTLAHAFGETVSPWDGTGIIAARANL